MTRPQQYVTSARFATALAWFAGAALLLVGNYALGAFSFALVGFGALLSSFQEATK